MLNYPWSFVRPTNKHIGLTSRTTKITRYIDNQFKEVQDLKSIVRQLTRIEDKNYSRFKIGVFNFICGISKILFGTMDNDDALYYAEKISSLEKEQIDFLTLKGTNNIPEFNCKYN
jgi:hypothetical protein